MIKILKTIELRLIEKTLTVGKMSKKRTYAPNYIPNVMIQQLFSNAESLNSRQTEYLPNTAFGYIVRYGFPVQIKIIKTRKDKHPISSSPHFDWLFPLLEYALFSEDILLSVSNEDPILRNNPSFEIFLYFLIHVHLKINLRQTHDEMFWLKLEDGVLPIPNVSSYVIRKLFDYSIYSSRTCKLPNINHLLRCPDLKSLIHILSVHPVRVNEGMITDVVKKLKIIQSVKINYYNKPLINIYDKMMRLNPDMTWVIYDIDRFIEDNDLSFITITKKFKPENMLFDLKFYKFKKAIDFFKLIYQFKLSMSEEDVFWWAYSLDYLEDLEENLKMIRVPIQKLMKNALFVEQLENEMPEIYNVLSASK